MPARLVQHAKVQVAMVRTVAELTDGTARTANLKTSCPFMAMLLKAPLAEASALLRGFKPN